MDPLIHPTPYGMPEDEDELLAEQQDPMYWLRKLADASSAGHGSMTPGEARRSGPQLI